MGKKDSTKIATQVNVTEIDIEWGQKIWCDVDMANIYKRKGWPRKHCRFWFILHLGKARLR